MSREKLDRLLGETIEHERRFDGLQIISKPSRRRILARTGQLRNFPRGASLSGNHVDGRLHRSGFFRRRTIEGINFQHIGNGRDPGNRLFGEFSDTEGQCPGQLAIEIDRTSAHSRDYAGVLHFLPVQPHQDDVSLWPVHVVKHAKNFHFHGLRFYPFEHGVSHSAHAGVNLADGDGEWICCGIRFLCEGQQGEKQANNRERGNQFFHVRRPTGPQEVPLMD